MGLLKSLKDCLRDCEDFCEDFPEEHLFKFLGELLPDDEKE